MFNSIGVIGGADGPTSILVSNTSPLALPVIGIAIALAAAVLVLLVYRNR